LAFAPKPRDLTKKVVRLEIEKKPEKFTLLTLESVAQSGHGIERLNDSPTQDC